VQVHLAGNDAAGRIDNLQDRARGDALAGTAFADDTSESGAGDVIGSAPQVL